MRIGVSANAGGDPERESGIHRRGGTFTLNNRASRVVSTAAESSLERTGDSMVVNIPG
jgi:hypothetical protein